MTPEWNIEHASVGELELEYRTMGSGRTLFLLSGIDDGVDSLPYQQRIAEHFSLILPSLPGFGRSPLPNWIDCVEDLVYLMLDAITELHRGRVHLLGTGFGGWIAAEMAVRSQENLDRLVLADAFGIKVSEPWERDIADIFVLSPEEYVQLAWHDPSRANAIKAPGTPGLSREELVQALSRRETAHRLGWKPFMHNPKLRRRLARIKIPTLVLWGESDRIVSPEYGRSYHASIPGSRFETIARSGHYPHLEQPDEFARLVTEFLEE